MAIKNNRADLGADFEDLLSDNNPKQRRDSDQTMEPQPKTKSMGISSGSSNTRGPTTPELNSFASGMHMSRTPIDVHSNQMSKNGDSNKMTID